MRSISCSCTASFACHCSRTSFARALFQQIERNLRFDVRFVRLHGRGINLFNLLLGVDLLVRGLLVSIEPADTANSRAACLPARRARRLLDLFGAPALGSSKAA